MRKGFATSKLSFLLLSGALTFSSMENGQINTSKLKYEMRHHTQVVKHVIASKSRLELVARKIQQVNSRIGA